MFLLWDYLHARRGGDTMTAKRWPFQASQQDKALIDRINAARPLDRTSVADAIRYALKYTAANDKEIAMDEKIETILHQYEADDAAMFGGDADLTAVDITASYNAYEDAILANLRAAYPGARVNVQSGPHRIAVNGECDHGEVPWIEQTIHSVWEAFDWVVPNAPEAEETARQITDAEAMAARLDAVCPAA